MKLPYRTFTLRRQRNDRVTPTSLCCPQYARTEDYDLKAMLNVPVGAAAPFYGAAATLTGWLGVAPPRIDRQIALGRELFPLDLCCLVCRRSDILYGIGGIAFVPAIIARFCLQGLRGFPRLVDGDHALRYRNPKPGQSA